MVVDHRDSSALCICSHAVAVASLTEPPLCHLIPVKLRFLAAKTLAVIRTLSVSELGSLVFCLLVCSAPSTCQMHFPRQSMLGFWLFGTSRCVPSIWPGCCSFPVVRYSVRTCCKDASEVSTGLQIESSTCKKTRFKQINNIPIISSTFAQHAGGREGIACGCCAVRDSQCQANYFFEKNWW